MKRRASHTHGGRVLRRQLHVTPPCPWGPSSQRAVTQFNLQTPRVRKIVQNLAFNEIKYHADLEKQYGEQPPIKCLPSQLNQDFMNLKVNAAHAMGAQRGKITLRTGTDKDTVWIEVEDNGSGIGPEIRDRIFDPFFTTKAIGKGTGLGLSLAYGIIKKHNGHIELDSEPGRGSTFRVILPQRHTGSLSTQTAALP